MSNKQRYGVSLIAALIVLVILIALTIAFPPHWTNLLPWFLFVVLIAFTTTFGVPLGGGRVSLLPMTTMAAYLVMGLLPAAWAAMVGALAHSWIRYRWSEKLENRPRPDLLAAAGLAAANATLQALSILVGGLVYQAVGGAAPLTELAFGDMPALVLLALTYLSVNLLMAGLYMVMRSLEMLKLYLRSLPNLLLYEACPMVFSPLLALVYTQFRIGQFLLLALAIVIISLVTRGLSLTSQRLERRVKELDSLQAVGQTLSASLDFDIILEAIHTQVAGLMPARNFYVALYDSETGEVSFPLAVEHDQRRQWSSRRAGAGLTEYVLRTRRPLLIREDHNATLQKLGIEQIGQPATSWLGVPLMAGAEPLGVLSVQSYSTQYAYDESHRDILMTIAAQAAVALQNARLYDRTDEALARRVQELNSILRTTREGILLLGPTHRVLAANRAMADFLGIALLELTGQQLYDPQPDDEDSLVSQIGYTAEALQADCQTLEQGMQGFASQEIVVPGPPERHVERTLTLVRDRQGEISGWLLIFRDVTEERELERLREDLTNMLVHDLRSPLTVLTSCFEMMKVDLARGSTDSFGELFKLVEKSSDRLLRLVNDLLDISRLESGQLTVHPQAQEARALLESAAERLAPLAVQAEISVEISTDPDLPLLYVDTTLLERVVHNLLDNALKFTPDGGQVRLWARLDAESAPATVLVGVSDTGPGIPLEAQSRLFKKFQQVVSNQGRRVGTGLGLPFCKLAVEAHGGEIWAESEGMPGKGSTFVMRLPIFESGE